MTAGMRMEKSAEDMDMTVTPLTHLGTQKLRATEAIFDDF
jgi:hypothetical protein